MPTIEELSQRQILDSLGEAMHKHVPLVLSHRQGEVWVSSHSQILRVLRDRLYLGFPQTQSEPPPAFEASMLVGASFKIRHHKHIFNVALQGISDLAIDGHQTKVLCLNLPADMQRVQRRAFERAEVPRNRSVLATFCQGSLPGQAPRTVTWEGWVIDISAGGFQVRLPAHGSPQLEGGDIVEVRLDMGQEYQPIQAKAQFRHAVTDECGAMRMGFQFVGLNESRHGRETLSRLGDIASDFARLAERRPGYETGVA